ncbi:BD1L1 protein, partial [Bombycilla garrulus]|nr:BD1L1 protein [Bombycilla garrulus]
PAYQNLRQRVDNFVSNHLATHTWSPHLNKNQLRNNIRQQVLKSGMLESGIDRIISQVVDPKINHTFRPQVEKAVHEFLATLNHKEEAGPSASPSEEKADASVTVQGVSATAPSANVASDAMSILETITSLNQEASAARASTDTSNPKNNDKVAKKLSSQLSVDGSTDKERNTEDLPDREKAICDLSGEGAETPAKCEDLNELPCQSEEIKNSAKDTNILTFTSKDIPLESEDVKSKLLDKSDKKPESSERKKEKKEKLDKKSDHSKKSDDTAKSKEEKQAKESEPVKQLVPERNSNKHKSAESTKEENMLIDSDMDVLSDITVSSVHTSDLSSFEEESEEDPVISDSTEEGEITSDEEEKSSQSKAKPQVNELSDGKAKPVRHAYVRKPFLYSKYFSDSDDERTVEQRRQSIAKEKEERLLRRRINRERLEEKRKQKAAEKTKSLKAGNQNAKGKSGLQLEEPSSKSLESKTTGTSIKDVLKEQKFLEKKVALSRKRKRDSRYLYIYSCRKKNELSEEDSKEMQKTNETCEKNSSKELKHNHGKNEISKQLRRLSDWGHSAEESKSDSKAEKEHKRRTSTSLQAEGAQQDNETRDTKKQLDKAEVSTEEPPKQKSISKNEKHPKKDTDTEIQHMRNSAKKEGKSYRDKNEKERTALEDKLSLRHKHKGDGIHKSGEDVEPHSFERSWRGEDGGQKHNQQTKISSDDKCERKSKHRSERKVSVTGKDGKNPSESTLKAEEVLRKENKKDRHLSTDKPRAECKTKRSLSDSKPQKDSLSASKQPGSASHRRSESYSEDKHEIESTNSDSNAKLEDGVHKDRRRSKSLAEDKILFKSKSKSHSKQSKASETELQELTKQDTGQKLDKDKSMEDNDSDKHKSRNEDKGLEENSAEFQLASGPHSTQGTQKDFSHRVKLHSGEKGAVKEKYRGDKNLSNSKLERRFSAEGHKSRNFKHSNKEIKKKEESIKLEDKDAKEMDSGHERLSNITLAVDKKQSKKISCENRKGSISNQDLLKEEKLSASTTESSQVPAPQKAAMNNYDLHAGHQGELMELDLKKTKAQESSKNDGKNTQNSLQSTDAKSTVKQKGSRSISNKELKHSLADPEACESQFLPAAGKTFEQEDTSNKQVGALDPSSKKASMAQGASKQGAYKMSIMYETSSRPLKNVSSKDQASKDSRRPKSLKAVINSSSDDVPLAINSSREDAADAKSMDMDISDFTDSLGAVSKECHNSDGTSLLDGAIPLKNDAAQVVYMEQDSAVLSSVTKDDGDSTIMANSMEKVNEVSQPDEQTIKDSTAGLCRQQDDNEAAKSESSQDRELKRKEENLMSDITEVRGDVTTKELTLRRKGREYLNIAPSRKGERSTMMDSVEKNKVHDTDDMIQSSSVLVPEGVPEESFEGSVIANGQEGTDVVSMEDKNENNAVGTSAGSSKPSSLYSSLQKTPASVIGTSTEKIIESTAMATSTGGERAEGTSHSGKDSDATTTCSEEESEVTVLCTSIEADEGFTTGIWVKRSEGCSSVTGADIGDCTVAAAEEGGGSVVTEGLAESESFLTSTEGEENGDCTMADAEEGGKDLVNPSEVEIEDSVNSAGTEEKDDAVTSAGSEEKQKTSACVDTGKFESSVSCLGEMESDGAVTSAGTETCEGSTSGDNSGEFRGSVTAGQVKEHEGTVTCTGAEERGHNSVTGTDTQGENTVTGACIAVVTNNSATAETSGDKSEDTVNGESAVTSTGITPEDDAEISAVCTGLEDSNEGFVVCLEAEKCESLMDSTRAKEEASITTVSVGLCDDEGFVTSTGSKEEDEEGEDIVTSTGRGNEENEHASTCTGVESESAVVCIGAEGESSIICIVAEQMEAESGVAGTDTNKLTVDSMTSAEKEANCGTDCKNDKGIVESSVTSA